MTDKLRIARNTAALSIIQFARTGFNMILSVLVARQLGVEGLGKYAVLTAYLHIFGVLSVAGVPRLVIREMARRPDQSRFWFQCTVVNQAIGAICSAVALILLANSLDHPADTTEALEIAALSLLPAALSSAIESLLQAKERMELITISQVIGNGVQTAVGILVLFAGRSILGLAWTILAGQCLVAAMEIVLTARMALWQEFRFDLRQALLLFKASFDFFLISLSVVIFNRLDVMILSQMLGEKAVGVYNAAYLVVRFITFLSSSYSDAVYPALSRLFEKERADFEALLHKSLLFGTVLTLLITIWLSVAAEPIISLLYNGQEYALSVLLLRIDAPFVIIFTWNAIIAGGLMASNFQQRSVIVSGVKLLAGLFYYTTLIALFRLPGAAVATVLAGLTGTVLNYYFLNKQVCLLDKVTLVVKPLTIGAIMALVVWIAHGISWLQLIVGGTTLYILLVITFRILSLEDIRTLWHMVLPFKGAR